MRSLIKKIIHSIRWPRSEQIRNLYIQLKEDERWLASEPQARAVIERYLPMVQDDWEKAEVEDIAKFRERVRTIPRSNYLT